MRISTISLNGFLKCDKPAGWTSFDVVARARAVISAAQDHRKRTTRIKVGHSGTLDPFATGLMILAVGPATKRLGTLIKADKDYLGTLKLGLDSASGDPEGPLQKREVSRQPTIGEVQAVLSAQLGTQQQVPPVFSAIKVRGQRAYALARQGRAVTLQPRTVTVYQIELEDYRYPELQLSCRVSSGMYIRVLAQKIGAQLGTGGYLTALRRLQIAGIDLRQALDPRQFDYDDIVAALKPEPRML